MTSFGRVSSSGLEVNPVLEGVWRSLSNWRAFNSLQQILTTITYYLNRQIEDSNTIPSWTPEAYKFASNRPRLQTVPAPKDFMSRLDGNVRSIDFNNCQPVKQEEESGGVIIHKRDRNTSPSSSGEQLRKKRFKLAPLGTATLTSLPSTSSQVREKPVPTDRNELLTLVRLYMINFLQC